MTTAPRRARWRSGALGAAAAVALAAAATALGLDAPARHLVASGTGVLVHAGAEPRAFPRGAYYGWVAPGEARVWLEAEPCDGGDAPLRLALTPPLSPGASLPSGLAAAAGPGRPSLVAGGAVTIEADGVAAFQADLGAGAPTSVLDVGAGLAGLLSADAAPRGAAFTLARVTCRSWREVAWRLGRLVVTAVDAPAGDSSTEYAPLRAFLLPEPAPTGVVALLLLQTLEDPVVVEAVGYAPRSVATGVVLAGAGDAQHWPEWHAQARAWGSSDGPPLLSPPAATVRPYWQAPGPTPPLTPRPADDLRLSLGPYSSAVVAIGRWSFRAAAAPAGSGPRERLVRRLGARGDGFPEHLLSFPTLRYSHGGGVLTVGLRDPLYLRSGR